MIPTDYTLEQKHENGPFYLCRGGQPLACPHAQPEVQVSEVLPQDTNLLTPGQKPMPAQKTTNYAKGCGTHCALFEVRPGTDTEVEQLCAKKHGRIKLDAKNIKPAPTNDQNSPLSTV